MALKLVEPGLVRTDFGGRSFSLSNDEAMAEYQEVVGKTFTAFAAAGKAASDPGLVASAILMAATDGSGRLR